MPRRKNSTPKYRLHKATGQAIVTLDGRDFYLGPHGSRPSRREYERLVGECILEQINGGESNREEICELTMMLYDHLPGCRA